MADYQFFAANPDKDFPAELYVRKDLIGLRATLPGGAKAARTRAAPGHRREAAVPAHGRGGPDLV